MCSKLSVILDSPLKQISNISDLHAEGATIPFIARYRKEAAGNLDEVQISSVIDKLKYYTELGKRKETILKTIEEAGKLDPDLKKRIEDCVDATVLEDIYLPYKPKRKTKASIAIEKGLEPLAKLVLNQGNFNLTEEANKYISEQVKAMRRLCRAHGILLPNG